MSINEILPPIKVGDEIAFKTDGFGSCWRVYEVEKITPSGRMKVGHYELNKDLTVRGRSGWGGPYRGHLMTDELREKIANERERHAIMRKVEDVRWRDVSLETLRKIDAVLNEEDSE